MCAIDSDSLGVLTGGAMRRKIDVALTLSPKQERLLYMHSVLNLLNVVVFDLSTLSEVLGDDELFRDAIDHAKAMARDLGDPSFPLRSRARVLNALVLSRFQRLESRTSLTSRQASEVQRWRDTLLDIFGVADERIRELCGEGQDRMAWQPVTRGDLRLRLVQVLDAIAKNSGGAFDIKYDQEVPGEREYVVDIQIDDVEGSVFMPPVFQDVIRDLVANARKYSLPGTTLRVRIGEHENALRIQVSDEGRGIPAQELEEVVQFGSRASNVMPHETRGGGFGLTKAYQLCRGFNGEMWIDSAEGKGTEVTLEIPIPRSDSSYLSHMAGRVS